MTTDATAAFFDELGRRGHEPLLGKITGAVRFEIADGDDTESWLVSVDKGEVAVGHDGVPADCTIRGQRAVFDEVARGRANALAAVLRGALTCTGELDLLFAIQRIFPDPPRGWDPTAETRSAG
jgi:putative sterol carrier protein